jgi:hypothetical protein
LANKSLHPTAAALRFFRVQAARSDDMPISQNACFSGTAAPDAEFEHPPDRDGQRIDLGAESSKGWEWFREYRDRVIRGAASNEG